MHILFIVYIATDQQAPKELAYTERSQCQLVDGRWMYAGGKLLGITS
jgi:hypothetical protein